MYWVPFIKKLGIDPERLIVLTRGGAHLWYPAKRHVELFSLRPPKDIRVENILTFQRTGMMKQQRWTAFDRQVVKDAAATLGLKKYLTLHPQWMYQTLAPFWESERGLFWLLRNVDIQNLPTVELQGGPTLPDAFVAVRFYSRATFPHGEVAHTVALETVKLLASQQPVILLNAGFHADDHVDFEMPKIEHVYKMTDLYKTTPENNLSIQSALIAKAQAFVGTYGGLAQLALLYKKPTVSFYQDWQGTCLAHKHLMDTIALQMGVTAQVFRVTDVPILHAAVPKLVIHAGPPSSSSHARELSSVPQGVVA